MATLLLFPGEFVLRYVDIKGADHQTTIRMLVNSLFWGLLGVTAAFVLTT